MHKSISRNAVTFRPAYINHKPGGLQIQHVINLKTRFYSRLKKNNIYWRDSKLTQLHATRYHPARSYSSWTRLSQLINNKPQLDQPTYLTKDCKACSRPVLGLSASSRSQSTGLVEGEDFKDNGIAADWRSSLCPPGVKSTEVEVLTISSPPAGFDLSMMTSLEVCMVKVDNLSGKLLGPSSTAF